MPRSTEPTPERIVIVGAGDCGTRAALRLRDLGFDGSIVLVGDEEAAPYERPTLSKEVLTGETDPPLIASADTLASRSIEWRRGTTAIHLDPERRIVSLEAGERLAYDRLLLATGARARRPPIAGGGHAYAIRNLADATRLRDALHGGQRIAVVGGGFIGLETAANAVASGCDVTVVEFAHTLMARVVPAPVADVVRSRHIEAGVDLRLGVGISSWSGNGTMQRLGLDDGSTVEADLVVAGIGAIPNTELASTAGLRIDNGIAVDAYLRTSDRSIWAAGDCCSAPHPLYGNLRVRIEAWRNAIVQSEISAANMLGGAEVWSAVPVFWSDQYELTLQVVGLHQAATRSVPRLRSDGHTIHFGLDHDGRLVAASGVAAGTTLARDILAAQRLIEHRAAPAPAELSDAATDLRRLG